MKDSCLLISNWLLQLLLSSEFDSLNWGLQMQIKVILAFLKAFKVCISFYLNENLKIKLLLLEQHLESYHHLLRQIPLLIWFSFIRPTWCCDWDQSKLIQFEFKISTWLECWNSLSFHPWLLKVKKQHLLGCIQ